MGGGDALVLPSIAYKERSRVSSSLPVQRCVLSLVIIADFLISSLLLSILFQKSPCLSLGKRMSCCGGNCGCGSGCKCGTGCGGCKMYPSLNNSETSSTTEVLIMGVAPQKAHFEGSEMGGAAENGGCKCGDNCTCDPCTCK